MTAAVFPDAAPGAGMYESFYLRAGSPDAPIGGWLRYTVHQRPGAAPQGSLWATVFDGTAPPVANKETTDALTVPAGGWIQIGSSTFGPDGAQGTCGPISWSLVTTPRTPMLRHLRHDVLYRAPVTRTKLTSHAPAA